MDEIEVACDFIGEIRCEVERDRLAEEVCLDGIEDHALVLHDRFGDIAGKRADSKVAVFRIFQIFETNPEACIGW